MYVFHLLDAKFFSVSKKLPEVGVCLYGPEIQGRFANDGCQGWSRANMCEDTNVPWALNGQVSVTATMADCKGTRRVCLLSVCVYTTNP